MCTNTTNVNFQIACNADQLSKQILAMYILKLIFLCYNLILLQFQGLGWCHFPLTGGFGHHGNDNKYITSTVWLGVGNTSTCLSFCNKT